MPIMRISNRVIVLSNQTNGIIRICNGANRKLLG